MDKRELLIQQIHQIPEPYLEEVLDFVEYLKTKLEKEQTETLLLSESALQKDWLLPEEEQAWKDL